MKMEIRHDPDGKKFFCIIDGLECLAEYEWNSDGVMEIVHTYVPPDLRNRGIAEAILVYAAKYAVSQGIRIVPTCSYAVNFFKKHKEFAKVLGK